MAQDDSRTSSLNEAGSTSKGCGGADDAVHQEEQEEHEGSWLQLGIGGGGGRTDHRNTLQDPLEHTRTRRPGLFDLDLKPPGGGATAGGGGFTSLTEFRAPLSPPTTERTPPLQPPFFFQQQHHPRATTSLTRLIFPHDQREFAWGYNRPNPNFPWIQSPPSPSSSSSSMLPGPYYARLFQHPGSSSSGGVDVAGPSSSFSSDVVVRVIDAPPRPHSGVWFVLEASPTQAKEPFLPQIPKSFLRIKDGRMTVLLLMKYLVNKLRLDSESEVEIRCRGQQLPPLLTLQHVRDNIWSTSSSSSRRDAMTLLPDSSSSSSTTDHFVMILHYGRTA
ncbi:protein LAX PANICLE 2-like [Telopea speciosissima]|uniref:protein LAX PANICLE 2-like n=1 Tax=Telopea speciosissima TaxID=54955 RepID=UPI001CC4E80E|nr:protein LAX PANICLE 2-like [Telopea speciosissima]